MENKTIQNINIEYERPRLSRKFFSKVVDALLFALIFLLSFISIRAIYSSTTSYKNSVSTLEEIRLNSGIYVEKDDNIINVSTFVYQDKKMSYGQKEEYLEKALNNFLNYIKSYDENSYKKVIEDLNTFKLSDSLIYQNKPLFIEKDNEIIKNDGIPAQIYVENFYTIYIDTNCNGFLSTEIKEYYQNTKYLSDLNIFLNIPLSIVISSLLIYFLPPIIFKRGRKTIGMLIYHISLVDENLLAVPFKSWILKFLIFYFLEFILSIFTLAIPLLISASMMLFSKNKQTFSEYMMKIQEIDDQNNKVYYSKNEAIKDNLNKDPVSKFRLR